MDPGRGGRGPGRDERDPHARARRARAGPATAPARASTSASPPQSGYATQRPYSLASAPEDPRLELTVERLGDGEVSPWLAGEARVGDRFEIRGPGGRSFSWHVDDGGPLLLVAGGAGLVPLRAMLRHRLAPARTSTRGSCSPCAREEDQLYAAELDGVGGGRRRRHGDAHARPGGRRVDADMLADAGPAPEARPHVFVCGPTAFVETAATLLLRAGHDPELRADRALRRRRMSLLPSPA